MRVVKMMVGVEWVVAALEAPTVVLEVSEATVPQ